MHDCQGQKEVTMSAADCRKVMFSPACTKWSGQVFPAGEGLQLTNNAHDRELSMSNLGPFAYTFSYITKSLYQ